MLNRLLPSLVLLEKPAYRRLALCQFVTFTGHYILAYALVVLVIESTDSALKTALLAALFSLPSLVFGLPAGILADFFPKRFVLAASTLFRGVTALILAAFVGDLAWLYAGSFVLSAIGQLYSPAETATVRAIIEDDDLPRANALLSLVAVCAQAVGMAVLGPLVIKTTGSAAVFVAGGAIYMLASVIAFRIPLTSDPAHTIRKNSLGVMAGWREIRSDPVSSHVVGLFVLLLSLARMLSILFPVMVKRALDVSTEDAVFLAAPAAVGGLVALVAGPHIVHWIGKQSSLAGGLLLVAAAMMTMAFTANVGEITITHGITNRMVLTMAAAIPTGFGFTVAVIAARTAVMERTPGDLQGSVHGTQWLLGEAISLAPMIVAGALADSHGVLTVMALAPVVVVVLALPLLIPYRKAFLPAQKRSEAEP